MTSRRLIRNEDFSCVLILVCRARSPQSDKWYDEDVNFYEDYEKLFGAEPGKVQGIGILTSSDATKSIASADYDDFILLP